MWKKLTGSGKALVIVIAVVVVAILVFSFLPIMRVSYEAEESYLTTETYYALEIYTVDEPHTVLEPYTAIEAYCDQEPCEKYIPIEYSVVSGRGSNYIESDGSPACSVELDIENTDVIGGTFTVEFLVTLSGDLTTTISGSKTIAAGATGKVIAYYLYAPLKTLYSFSYSVFPPEKPNPSYREEEVIRYREVVEYGEVTKSEYVPKELTVLKTRTVTAYKRVSLLDHLMNY
ncbi:MAG: hypothetical protein A2Z76_00540 [Chloroflexi bacterium RBG_13_56_8b]|nr:MAG: hypothetical protein A2Z76_00540 [Chloroflexi bacterium RBG_13_56_8b]